MDRDNDVIRAVGYVTIQASHLEGSIEEVALGLGAGISRPDNHETVRISDKIRWCKKAILELGSPELSQKERTKKGRAHLKSSI